MCLISTSDFNLVSDYFKRKEVFVKEIQKRLPKGVAKMYKYVGHLQTIKAVEVFTNAVNAFYDDYTPTVYSRRHDLRKMLDIKYNSDGTVHFGDPPYESLYDKNKAPEGRKGYSLFDKVFVQGFHGGAENISDYKAEVWWEHPSPGTPYYRRKGQAKVRNGGGKRFMHRYGKWGRPAKKMTPAPLDLVIEGVGKIDDQIDDQIMEKWTQVGGDIVRTAAKISGLKVSIS